MGKRNVKKMQMTFMCFVVLSGSNEFARTYDGLIIPNIHMNYTESSNGNLHPKLIFQASFLSFKPTRNELLQKKDTY